VGDALTVEEGASLGPDAGLQVAALAAERAALVGRPAAGSALASPFSEALIDRYPVLDERGPDVLGVVPFRRAALTEIQEDLTHRRSALQAEIAQAKGLGATT
jgi:hypothetical protein